MEDIWRAYANLSAALNSAGELQGSIAVGRAGVARMEDMGYDDGAASLRCVTAGALRTWGAWEEADDLAAQALQGQINDFIAWTALEVRTAIAARRGDFAAAHGLLEGAQHAWSTLDAEFRTSKDLLLVELAILEGRVDTARTLIDAGLDAVAGSDGQDHVQQLLALALRVEADEATGAHTRNARTRAHEASERAERLIEQSRATTAALARGDVPVTPFSDVLGRQCEAEFARANARHEPELWEQVVQGWIRRSQRYEVAYARFRKAESHLGAAQREPAASALRESFALATDIGAAPIVANMQTLARRARIRLPVRADKPPSNDAAARPESPRARGAGPAGVAGHTNREIARPCTSPTRPPARTSHTS